MPSYLPNRVNVNRDKQKGLKRVELNYNRNESWAYFRQGKNYELNMFNIGETTISGTK